MTEDTTNYLTTLRASPNYIAWSHQTDKSKIHKNIISEIEALLAAISKDLMHAETEYNKHKRNCKFTKASIRNYSMAKTHHEEVIGAMSFNEFILSQRGVDPYIIIEAVRTQTILTDKLMRLRHHFPINIIDKELEKLNETIQEETTKKEMWEKKIKVVREVYLRIFEEKSICMSYCHPWFTQ